jgi:hypothetical protein
VGSGFTKELLDSVTDSIIDQKLEVKILPNNYDMGRLKVDTLFKPSLIFEVHAQ